MIEQTSVSSVIHSLRIFGFKTLPNWLDAVWLKRESCEEHRRKEQRPRTHARAAIHNRRRARRPPLNRSYTRELTPEHPVQESTFVGSARINL